MQYTVEDVSPVKKTVRVTVPAAEVNAVLDKNVARYRQSVALPGFRKGKAPMGMVEKRFSKEIYDEAGSELVNDNIAGILKELDQQPLTGLQFDGAALARGQEYAYSFTYEIMPEFEVPAYEGVALSRDKVEVKDEEIDTVIERVRRSMSPLRDVAEKRLPVEGDVVTISFAGTDDAGEAVPGVSGENFQVAVGEKQVIPDFEKLLCAVLPGESGEGKVTFPEDYHSKELAGKTVNMKITVDKLQTRTLPEVTDEFAKQAGGFESVAAMRDNVRTSYERNRAEMAKAKAQSELLEKLLSEVDFPLPEGMVERYLGNILTDRVQNMQRQGQDFSSFKEEEFEKLKAEAKVEAEKYAKTQLFLLTVARKENLDATPQEMEAALRQMAARGGHNPAELREHYVRNNLLPALRDRILADKAMDAMYNKAAVTEKE